MHRKKWLETFPWLINIVLMAHTRRCSHVVTMRPLKAFPDHEFQTSIFPNHCAITGGIRDSSSKRSGLPLLRLRSPHIFISRREAAQTNQDSREPGSPPLTPNPGELLTRLVRDDGRSRPGGGGRSPARAGAEMGRGGAVRQACPDGAHWRAVQTRAFKHRSDTPHWSQTAAVHWQASRTPARVQSVVASSREQG